MHGYTLAVNVNPPEGGSVTIGPSPGADGNYDPGQLVFLASLPNQGYIFVGWSGDHATARSTTAVTMDSDKAITATFHRR